MKKTRKILLMAACAILLVCISVGATVAYLTSTDSVTNTFTVGKVAITLDEAKVTEYGVAVQGADRVKVNEYKLMPSHSYVKDPTVHFAAGSEASWLFVKVENEIAAIEDKYTYGDTDPKKSYTIAEQIADNGWHALNGVANVYYKEVVANTGANAVDYKVFDGFKIKDNAVIASFAPETTVNAEGKTVYTKQTKVTITAYAVQKDGFDTAKDAWDATFGALSTNP